MKTIDANAQNLKTVNEALRKTLNSQPVIVTNAGHIHGLVAGFDHGEVIIQGNAGDYLGVLNSGATIRVTKNAGNYAADNMTGGTVIIDGNAAYGAAQYSYAGTVVVRGDAGDFTATMNKGGTVIVEGDVGDEVATYMLKGEVIILGNAGENLANYLIEGTVYIRGDWKSLGHNTRIESLTTEDVTKLRARFDEFGVDAKPESFKKIVAASKKPFYK